MSQLVVAINKMDTVGWSQPRYLEIASKLSVFLKQAGFKDGDIEFIPCSGLNGVNLVRPAAADIPEFRWFTGKPLITELGRWSRSVVRERRRSGATLGMMAFRNLHVILMIGERVGLYSSLAPSVLSPLLVSSHRFKLLFFSQTAVQLILRDFKFFCVSLNIVFTLSLLMLSIILL